MKRLIDFFSLTTGERRGLIALFVLIAIVLLIPIGYKYHLSQQQGELTAHIGLLGLPAEEELAEPEEIGLLSSENENHFSKSPVTLSPFNPNNLPVDQWRALGFSDKQIRVIKNYEAKGGRFYSKADVAKIYSISDKDFKRIEPYLRFAEKEKGTQKAESIASFVAKENTPVLLIDMNRADTTEFKRLKGIGSVFANRIVKFRDALGGFHSKEQLREVYGLSEELYASIEGQLSEGERKVKKLSINAIAATELARHPYISKKQADIILRYREQHGSFQSMESLRDIVALNADFLRKIEPYLVFEY